MGTNSAIEWTECTWNPVTGCTKISAGCAHCYAERLALRLQAMGNPRYTRGFQVTLHEDLLDVPLKWQRPRMVFVNSMSDLFHERVPLGFVLRVFKNMKAAQHHTFQVLTKRSARLRKLDARLPWAPNFWMGVSAESAEHLHRVDHLRETRASVKFLSLEPLLGAIPKLDLTGIDWVIVGGESGPGARPMRKSWVVDVWQQCRDQGVPFFFKQWGGVQRTRAGRELNGRTWDEYPRMAAVGLRAGAKRKDPQQMLALECNDT